MPRHAEIMTTELGLSHREVFFRDNKEDILSVVRNFVLNRNVVEIRLLGSFT